MFSTILIGILFLVALIGFVGFFLAPRKNKLGWVGSGLAAFIIGLLTLGLSSSTIVPTRDIGIVTTFGKPNGELSNGLHWVAPWQDVTNMDGAIQLEKFEGDHPIQVRLGNNSTANAAVTIQWRLDPASTPQLFLDYRTFDGIRDNLVNKELQVAVNTEFAKFDPLAPGAADGAPLVAISEKVQKDVQAAVGTRIEIQKVFVPLVSYDDQTQQKINALNIEKANTRVAEQQIQTNTAQASANDALRASVSNDPNVITNNCMTAAIAKGISPFGCWPNQSAIPMITPGH